VDSSQQRAGAFDTVAVKDMAQRCHLMRVAEIRWRGQGGVVCGLRRPTRQAAAENERQKDAKAFETTNCASVKFVMCTQFGLTACVD